LEPPRQARLPTPLLARAASRSGHTRHRRRDVDRREATHRDATRRQEMSTVTSSGAPVDTDAEGFFVDPEQWNEAMGPQIAAANGVGALTDRHCHVINFMRKTYLERGSGPS